MWGGIVGTVVLLAWRDNAQDGANNDPAPVQEPQAAAHEQAANDGPDAVMADGVMDGVQDVVDDDEAENDNAVGGYFFTLAQHYFSTPVRKQEMKRWYIRERFEIVCWPHSVTIVDADAPVPPAAQEVPDEQEQPLVAMEPVDAGAFPAAPGEQEPDEAPQHVVPLIAVDFGCAVWLEYVSRRSMRKRLRFVSFPGIEVDRGCSDDSDAAYPSSPYRNAPFLSRPGDVKTLEIPKAVNLEFVNRIGVDQAQGSVTLGLTDNRVFMLKYE